MIGIRQVQKRNPYPLGILNAAGVETLFPKKAMSLPNPTFYKTVNVQGSKVKSQAIRVRFSLSGESFSLFKV